MHLLNCRRREGTADGSNSRHCPWAPKSGGVDRVNFRVGAGIVRPNVMSEIRVGSSADTHLM